MMRTAALGNGKIRIRTAHIVAVLMAASLFLALSALWAQSQRFHSAPAIAAGWKNPLSGKPDAAEAGAALYAQNCSSCHGTRAEGSGNVPDLRRGATQSAADGEIYWYITDGDLKNGMPAWGVLTKQQRWQVVAYLKTLPGTVGTAAPAAATANLAMEAAMRAWPPPHSPFTDFRYEHPGAVRKITVADLPPPYATKSAGNAPRIVARPDNAWPLVPEGFVVELYSTGLDNPRLTRVAPNGDIFVAESASGDVKVFRGFTPSGKPERVQTFAKGMKRPYGINFYPPGPNPQFVYIGQEDAVLRFPYQNGDMTARGPAEHLATLPPGGNHWTRDIVFRPDGKKMLVSVGSASNVDDTDTHPAEKNRATSSNSIPTAPGCASMPTV